MAQRHKKMVLTVKKKLKLVRKVENGESSTKLAEDYGMGIERLHP
jgi:hypothetical protein